MRRKKISLISGFHYVRLTYRAALLCLLLRWYVTGRLESAAAVTGRFGAQPPILMLTWAVFALEMLLRFFPSPLESPGSQKQFRRNYIKSGETEFTIPDNNATVLTALIWIIGNGVIGSLHMMGVLDDGIMLLLCSAYSVCDMICILFFCPFQTWLLKNKCCGTCRIYNWDYAMMFTPLFFVGGAYARSLLVMSVVLLLRWELTFYLHSERFSEQSNEFLRCRNCREKLCAHKTQLKTHWRAFEEYSRRKREALRK